MRHRQDRGTLFFISVKEKREQQTAWMNSLIWMTVPRAIVISPSLIATSCLTTLVNELLTSLGIAVFLGSSLRVLESLMLVTLTQPCRMPHIILHQVKTFNGLTVQNLVYSMLIC